MNDFKYNSPANIYFGKNAIQELSRLVDGKTVMLVYGEKSAKSNGVYDTVTRILSKHKIKWVEFDGNSSPSYQKVLNAITICKQSNVGCVIGIGGCTCMDMAKIIAFGTKNDDLWKYLDFSKPVTGKEEHLLIGAIPTYPSGGSEADEAAEIDNEETGEHGSLYGVYADFSILNPEFTYSLAKEQTSYAAMVTFIQASICYLEGDSPIAEGFTKTVLNSIQESVKAALEDPYNYEARATQMWASALSTMGILSCGKGKSWAWSIYSDLEIIRKCMPISYRQAITILFPRWLNAKARYHGDEVRRYLALVTNIDESLPVQQAVTEGVIRIIEMFENVGLPMYYSVLGTIPDKAALMNVANEEENELTIDEIVEMYMHCIDKDTSKN